MVRVAWRWLLLCGTVFALAACTHATLPTTHAPSEFTKTGPATAQTRPAGTPARRMTTVLTCQDSVAASVSPGPPKVNGVAGGALTGTHVKPEEVFTVAGADGRDYLLWKTFLNVAPSAAPYRLISVARPASARLYYADPNTWGNATDAEHVADATKRVRLPACGSEWAGYTGGIIVPGPACVTLTIAAPHGGARKHVTVPIARRHC